MDKLYRCGWCGNPTDKIGVVLTMEQCDTLDESLEEELTQGSCCEEQAECHQEIITREMAMDAQDLSLEGQPY